MTHMIRRSGKTLTKLEKVDERRFARYARSRGCIVRKFDSRADDPDRIILCPGGLTLFVEFKREGAEPRAGQLHRLSQVSDLGFPVCVAHNFDEASDFLDAFLDET